MWYLLLILPTNLLAAGEVLTLLSREDVTCVATEESVYSALYVNSSSVVVRPPNRRIEWYVDENDWNITSVKSQDFYPVTDLRWENFSKIASGFITLNQAATSFSLCFTGKRLMISAFDALSNMEFIHLSKNMDKVRDKNFCQWSHYVVNRTTIWQVFENFELKKVWEMSFLPQRLMLPKGKVIVKIHEYDFRYSLQSTLNDAISYLDLADLSNSSSLCISMFVSLDENCYLDLILESGDTNQKRIKGFNKKQDLKIWKRIEIKTDHYNGTGKLIFFRTRDDNIRLGFWAIDKIDLCKPHYEISKIESNKKPENIICRTLDMKDESDKILCHETGFLGKSCDVNCEQILGVEFPFCEKHKICAQNGLCVCSWNYRGPDCDQVVFNEKDVLKCKNNNTLGCMRCKKRYFGIDCSKQFPVVLEAPKLQSITENSIIISLGGLKYNPDEAQPEFYQIQYKEKGEPEFRNFSSPMSYSLINETVVIGSLSTKEFGYKIRVILFAEDQFFGGDIPELITYKKTLEASVGNSGIVITWKIIDQDSLLLNYKCTHNWCLNHTISRTIRAPKNPFTIQNLENFNCCLKLISIDEESNETKLLDEINTSSRLTTEIQNSEMPTDLYFEKGKIVLEFEECAKFYGAIKYFLTIKCEHCNEPINNFELDLQTFSNIVEMGFEKLQATTTYQIEVEAQRENSTRKSFFVRTTLKSLEIQSRHDKTQLLETKLEYILFLCICILIVIVVAGFLYLRRKSQTQSDDSATEELLLVPSAIQQIGNKNIKVDQLEAHLKSTIFYGNHIRDEFESIPNEKFDICEVGLKKENLSKNRDRNFLPYDSTRVVLRSLEATDTSDYINASYIEGYNRSKAYIACQGPKFSTVTDFWGMIWQEQVETIIMATDFVETNGSRNCAEYWAPTLDMSCNFGKFSIVMSKEKAYQNYNYRFFDIKCENQHRKIRHFQFKSSHELYSDDFLPILRQLRYISRNSPVPIVIHSSLGINRSGIYILCDLALQMAEDTGSINFRDLLKRMRRQRPHMINNIEYYKLAKLTVLEFIMEKDIPIKKILDEDITPALVAQQISFTKSLYWHDEALRIVPETPIEAGILIDGYARRNQFLLYRQPNKEQISEFWKTVITQNAKLVVFLNSTGCKLWPHRYDDPQGIVNISLVGKTQMTPLYCINNILLTCSATTPKVLNDTNLYFFEFKAWDKNELTPKSINGSLSFLNPVMKTAMKEENPIIVVSDTEFNHDGLFVVLYSIIEKYEKETETDVCKFLRIIKRRKFDFSIHPLQLKFIYDSLLEYLKNFDHYNYI